VAAKLKNTNIRIMARFASLKMSSCFMRLAKALGSLSFICVTLARTARMAGSLCSVHRGSNTRDL
jgi:hypothetical protein